jgi:hypothetical protein
LLAAVDAIGDDVKQVQEAAAQVTQQTRCGSALSCNNMESQLTEITQAIYGPGSQDDVSL